MKNRTLHQKIKSISGIRNSRCCVLVEIRFWKYNWAAVANLSRRLVAYWYIFNIYMLWGQIISQTALPSVCFVSFKHFSNPSSVFFYILMFDKQPVSGCVDGLAVGSAVGGGSILSLLNLALAHFLFGEVPTSTIEDRTNINATPSSYPSTVNLISQPIDVKTRGQSVHPLLTFFQTKIDE